MNGSPAGDEELLTLVEVACESVVVVLDLTLVARVDFCPRKPYCSVNGSPVDAELLELLTAA